MALGVIISLGLAKVTAVVALAKVARRKKQSQESKGEQNKCIARLERKKSSENERLAKNRIEGLTKQRL